MMSHGNQTPFRLRFSTAQLAPHGSKREYLDTLSSAHRKHSVKTTGLKKTCTVTYPNNIPYTHLYTNTSMWSLPTKKADHFPFPHGFSTSFSMFTPRSHGDATRVAVPRCHWPRRTSGQCSRCGLAPQIHPTLWKKSWACNGTSHLATGAGSLPSTVCMIIIIYIYIIYIYSCCLQNGV